MLVIKLIGGLGNQMFQYAFGRSIANHLHVPLKFDVRDLLDRTPRPNFTFRNFELGIFKDAIPIATSAECELFDPIIGTSINSLKQRVIRKLFKPRIYNEKQNFVYDDEVLTVGSNTYFNGYWQNEKYFLPYEPIIRQNLRFKSSPIGANASLAEQIARSKCAVSVHVRRGDYVANAYTNGAHGTCSLTYYREAVKVIRDRVGEIQLFVFSDEPSWAKENLCLDEGTIYVSHNQGDKSFEDMRLMSLCSHNIIANSSFSWWGAWLNNNADKVVVAPSQWMQHSDIDYSDLIPRSWIRI